LYGYFNLAASIHVLYWLNVLLVAAEAVPVAGVATGASGSTIARNRSTNSMRMRRGDTPEILMSIFSLLARKTYG
jgi:hypothetical protein